MIWTLMLQSLPAFPCAALTTRPGQFAMSDVQEVILKPTDGGGSEASYRVTYDGDAEAFGWLIVVPGTASDVTEGNDLRFDQLREATDPEVVYIALAGGGGGCGCLGGGSKSGAVHVDEDVAGGDSNSLEVLSEGFAGPYTYTVLEADDTDALIDWLDTNGFDLGGTETTVSEYVDEGGFSFVAVTLTPETAETPEEGRKLPPLTISTDADALRFPARMALTGEPEWVQTVVWVEGESRATIASGWTEQREDYLYSGDQDPSEYYSEYLQSLARDTPTYLQVYSGEINGLHVTRFDTYAARGVHTEDVVFDFTGSTDVNRLTIEGGEEPDTGSGLRGVLIFLPLLGMGWGLRRRLH